MDPVLLQVAHLGGHPGLSPGQKRLWLYLSGGLSAGVFSDPRIKHELAVLEWNKVSKLTVEGPDSLGARVTVPRLAAGGIFAFAFKKEQKRSYLVFSTDSGNDVIFEVHGKSIWDLRAALSPLLNWLGPETRTHPNSIPPPQPAT